MSDKKMPYQYEEKPASLLVTRRAFLKVTGVLTAYLAIGGYTITNFLKKRNKYIKMRQKGLYLEVSHHLLHTHHYYARWQLGAKEVHHG